MDPPFSVLFRRRGAKTQVMALIGLPQLIFVFVAVLVAWAILRRRDPF